MVFLQSHLIMPGGHLTRNRKQKNMSNVWPKEWLPTREFLKHYLTEKQNGHLQSGCYERVVCWKVMA